MSTIEANNIKKGAKIVDTDYVIDGSAKSWCKFNGTGTVAIADSLNISSLVDNGAGDYTGNVSNDLANTDYSLTVSFHSTGTSRILGNAQVASPFAVDSFDLQCGGAAATTIVELDPEHVSVVVHGDLA